MKKLILVLWLAGLAILAAACGGDDEDIGTLPLTDQQLLNQGWSAFASAQYDQALASVLDLPVNEGVGTLDGAVDSARARVRDSHR